MLESGKCTGFELITQIGKVRFFVSAKFEYLHQQRFALLDKHILFVNWLANQTSQSATLIGTSLRLLVIFYLFTVTISATYFVATAQNLDCSRA